MTLGSDGRREDEHWPPPECTGGHPPSEGDRCYEEEDRKVGVPWKVREHPRCQPKKVDDHEGERGAAQPTTGMPDGLNGGGEHSADDESRSPQETVIEVELYERSKQPELQGSRIVELVPY